MLLIKKTHFHRALLVLAVALMIVSNIQTAAYASSIFTVFLVDGGKTTARYGTPRDTVATFLDRYENELGELDTLSHDPKEKVEREMVITITRREYVTVTETKDVKPETVYVYSPEVKAGEEVVVQEGSGGITEFKWSVCMVNGIEQGRELISQRQLTPTVDRRVEMGFRSVPFSAMNFEYDFDSNHEPIGYKTVLRDQRSAGYSARQGAGTASGIARAGVGYVAVNPNVIPYGSKLFVQSRDGKYIYGYAIAADTGIALMEGIIAIDCFYATYQESADHGIRNVDIFVLE